MTAPLDYDIVIVGAGMVGTSLAIALAPSGLRIAIVESVSPKNHEQSTFDERGITLTPSSQRIFEQLDVWQYVRADSYPIKHIHVSEQGRFGFTRLDASSAGMSELGHVVVARSLGQALHRCLQQYENIDLICPAELKQFNLTDGAMSVVWQGQDGEQTVNAGLLVGADGSNSLVRRLAGINVDEYDFQQTAIVANVTTQKTNNATAYERFTPHGPIAMLPIGERRSVLVFAVNSDEARTCINLSDEDYISRVQQELGRRLGNIEQLGVRRAYPIIFRQASRHYQQQLLLLGNSAHTLHPNAAQGFNLGLRDVAGLADAIYTALEKGLGIEDISILKNYMEARTADQRRVTRFTNGLAKTFYNRWPVINSGRNLCMILIDLVPPLKQSFTEAAMGLSGLQPGMVRGELQ